MKKLHTFFYVFKKSITSPDYYNDIVRTNFWFSMKYFLVLSLFASLIFTTISSIVIIPRIMSETNLLTQNLKESFPKDLVIDFKEGSWEVNKEQPIIIPMPNVGPEAETYFSKNLVVFDENGTINQIEEMDTLILFNNENVIYKNENGELTARPLSSIPNFKLDESTINTGFDRISKFLKFMPYIIPIGIFIFVFLVNYLSGAFVVAIIVGLVLFVISSIIKRKISFSNACKISIHSMTIPIILQLVMTAFPEVGSYLPNWFLILNFMIAIFFRFKMEEEFDLKKIE